MAPWGSCTFRGSLINRNGTVIYTHCTQEVHNPRSGEQNQATGPSWHQKTLTAIGHYNYWHINVTLFVDI